MKIYGYVRVSTAEQNEDTQLDAMTALNIPQNQIFTDKQSGTDFKRPSWKLLMKKLKPGDLLCIKSIDRLGRNYEEIQTQWRIITKKRNVDIAVLDMPLLDTRIGRDLMGTFLSDIVLQVLSFSSQYEQEKIKKRQADGIKSAKARGVKFGRPVNKPPENFGELIKLADKGKLTHKEIMQETGLKQTTFYSRLREYRAGQRKW